MRLQAISMTLSPAAAIEHIFFHRDAVRAPYGGAAEETLSD
jgi:hypothetical protein